ncbi:iron ABC transporter permease [Clostridium aestuarii]|uniref:Iron ABC transporter permease n=1 Tax=Clostridium aestuarii TaxID=338193 RepID=A0ABT4D1K8_9CLOT|nr:iron ABC transporter permease [Clostridium aestuarii]MCY6485129.1 iron ABC transporter permease [Clostridium aestuarii]
MNNTPSVTTEKKAFSHLRQLNIKWIIILLAILVLVIFEVIPMIYLVIKSFIVNESSSLANYSNVYSKSVNWSAFINTFKISLLVMLLSLVITFPLAWLIGRTDLPGKKFFRTFFITTYMIPPYVGGIAWTQLLNPNVGYLNKFFMKVFHLSSAPFNIYSTGGLVWVLTLFYSPFAFITISRALEKMDPTLEEGARISGASPLRTMFNITLPLTLPSILAGGLLVFVSAASAFGIPSIVGMPAGIEVLTTRIVSYVYLGSSKGVSEATALAVSLMVVANFILFLSTTVIAAKEYVTISGKSTRPTLVELGKWKKLITAIVSIYGFIAVVLPIGSIVITSLLKTLSKPISLSNLTFKNWYIAISNPQYIVPIKNSFIYAIITAIVGTLVSLLISYLVVKTNVKGRKIPDFLVTLGSATPSVVIALAMIITFSGKFGLNLYSTASILIISYLIKYLMMGVRTISASLSQVHESLEEAALNSGASWLRTLKDIIFPLIAPSIIASWFLIFMPSFYELSMSILLYGSKTKTIGVLLYELQTYADPQSASILSVLILLIVLIGNLVMRKFSKGNIGI